MILPPSDRACFLGPAGMVVHVNALDRAFSCLTITVNPSCEQSSCILLLLCCHGLVPLPGSRTISSHPLPPILRTLPLSASTSSKSLLLWASPCCGNWGGSSSLHVSALGNKRVSPECHLHDLRSVPSCQLSQHGKHLKFWRYLTGRVFG